MMVHLQLQVDLASRAPQVYVLACWQSPGEPAMTRVGLRLSLDHGEGFVMRSSAHQEVVDREA